MRMKEKFIFMLNTPLPNKCPCSVPQSAGKQDAPWRWKWLEDRSLSFLARECNTGLGTWMRWISGHLSSMNQGPLHTLRLEVSPLQIHFFGPSRKDLRNTLVLWGEGRCYGDLLKVLEEIFFHSFFIQRPRSFYLSKVNSFPQ